MITRLTGADLRAIRLKLGLTQEEAAQRVGCTVSSWCRWEKGHMRPSRLACQAIAHMVEEAKTLDVAELADDGPDAA